MKRSQFLREGESADQLVSRSVLESYLARIVADAGPGERVPASHRRDSANVNGNAIPAVLCGNQYAVLFDTGPTENEILY